MSCIRFFKGAVLATAIAGFSAPAMSATTWDLPLAWPDGNFHVENAKRFAAEVGKATDGEVVINIHPGGSLGFKGPEMLRSVRDGLIPIGDVLLNQQVGEAPLLGLEATPYLANGHADLQTFHRYWRPEVEALVGSRFNQKVLYMVPWPRQYVYTKVEIKRIEDLGGIKIRTYNKTTTGMFNRVGMTAVQLPWGEVVPSLAAGTIDAVTTSASSGVDGKFWEFLSYMYPTNHVWSSNAVTVNLDSWNALSAGQRQTIEALAQRLEADFWEVSKQEDTKKVEILNSRGVKTGTVTPDMMAAMQQQTAPMLDELLASIGDPAPRIINDYKKALGRN